MKPIKAVPVGATPFPLPFALDAVSELARQRVRQALGHLAQAAIAYMPVRCAGGKESLSVLLAIGVRSTGEKALLSMTIMGGESTAAGSGLVRDRSCQSAGRNLSEAWTHPNQA